MPVTLPRLGRGGGGPGRRGGRDGGRGRGGQGGPLPCRERNPMLASNSRNSTLATSISPLPCTPAPSAAVDGHRRRWERAPQQGLKVQHVPAQSY